MSAVICFLPDGANATDVAGRHRVACAAMRRYVPHVVAWECAQPGAPIRLVLPELLSARETVRRAAQAQVLLAMGRDTGATADRAIEIHYAHLADAAIDEGLCRLGRCLVQDLALAMHVAEPALSDFGP